MKGSRCNSRGLIEKPADAGRFRQEAGAGRFRQAAKRGWQPAAVLAGTAMAVAFGASPAPAATLDDAAPAAAAGAAAAIAWHPCQGSPALRCGNLSVPLDWSHPSGPKISLALDLQPATNPGRRVGALLINPGGPGASGVVLLKQVGTLFPAEIRERFDIVGFDPRGVGASTPITCDNKLNNNGALDFPTSPAQFRRLVAYNRQLGESCLRDTGPLFYHVDTVSAARDMEAIRAALGEGKLNYLGFSYGSMLGTAYAELFPHEIRTMALDAIVDHSLSVTSMQANEMLTAEDEFDRFAAWCNQESACALHGQDVAAVYDHLIATANKKPIPAPALHTTVTGTEIQAATQGMLTFKEPLEPGIPDGWAAFSQMIAKAVHGDASAFAPDDADPSILEEQAVECLDFTSAGSYPALANEELMGRELAPHLQGVTQTLSIDAGCPGWPAQPVDPPAPAHVTGAPPILLVNSAHDPETSYLWAQGVAAQIPGSVLLTRDGDGHSSYFDSTCANQAMDSYLLHDMLPKQGTICTG